MLAIYRGNLEIVKFLIDHGTEINTKVTTREGEGSDALMEAAFKGYTEIVKLLIAKGADVNAKNKLGLSALKLAERNGQTEIANIIKIAIEKASPNKSNFIYHS